MYSCDDKSAIYFSLYKEHWILTGDYNNTQKELMELLNDMYKECCSTPKNDGIHRTQ